MDEDALDAPGQSLRRREFLVAGAAAGIAVAGPINHVALARGRKVPFAKGGKFRHGVASGFPTDRGITLWTRVDELERSSRLRLEVAKDEGFSRIVKSRTVTAKRNNDFTVHERIAGLKPNREYYYRFETERKESRVGRFRTLPPPDSERKLRIGFYSCQDWQAGYFNAQAGLAREDLDFVICLGDYVYEKNFYEGPRRDQTGENNDGNVQKLKEYREKYRFYQADGDLQDMHAAHALISIWDDHEVEDNYAGDDPDSAQPDRSLENDGTPRRVKFRTRRKNGYRAYFEAMPRIRMESDRNRIYGSYRLGSLAELFLMDQRQYRDQQPCGDAMLTPCPEADDPGRTMLGAEQKRWLKGAVPASQSTWKLLGSEVMLMSVDAPRGQPAILDAWDGYGAERQEILEHFRGQGVENLAALTGDIHTFVAGDLKTTGDDSGDPVGVELVGGSATSLGIPEALGVSPAALEALAATQNPHLKYYEFESRGYAVLDVTKDRLICDLKAVDAITKGADPTLLKRLRVDAGDPHVQA